MFPKNSLRVLSHHKFGVALVILAIAIGGVSAQASGILNSPAGGYLLCVTPKTNLVTHPSNTNCPKGYGHLNLGAVGPTGASGLNGATGADGATGQNGTQGIAGVKGDTGPQGPTGANGAAGPVGSNGANGTNGAAGAAGATGAPGSNASLTCAQGGTCVVGDTGPGGGIVFYVQTATAAAPWRYLEVAPNTWSGGASDPGIAWCANSTAYLAQLTDGVIPAATATLTTVGSGFRNTKLLLGSCTFGAANMAASYNGGGKSDWFLPAKDELNELCKYAQNEATGVVATPCANSISIRAGFQFNVYWSSTEGAATSAWWQNFTSITVNQNSGVKSTLNLVRPVRAF